jgi:hypothetical protein
MFRTSNPSKQFSVRGNTKGPCILGYEQRHQLTLEIFKLHTREVNYTEIALLSIRTG